MPLLNNSSLDDAPLLQAEFREKHSGLGKKPLRQWFGTFTNALSVQPIVSNLKPSFLDRDGSPAKVHPTAWLDGVRGYASFCVFIYHFQHLFHTTYLLGYGSNGGDNDHWLIQLPVIRLIFTGGPMVSVFWVLSGISLSLKPLQLARSQSWEKFLETMFSSIFRRALRLYMPVYFVQCCVLVATCLGMYNHAFALSKDWPFGGTNEDMFEVFSTNTEQIQDWLSVMWDFANPFRPLRPKYDVHLWTIPLEFRNSIILFATLVGFAKLRNRVRTTLTLALYTFCVLVEEGDIALFIAGMSLAEFLLIRDENAASLPTAENPSKQKSTKSKAIWMTVLYVGLHFLSWPAHKYETSPGYVTMHKVFAPIFNSTELTFQRMGAAIFLLALCGYDWLRTPFQTSLAVYMGKISFPLYIVHGPINHILGTSLVEIIWSIIGNETLFAYELGVWLSFACCAIIVIWLADLLMRIVDAPSVRFGRTLQNRWSR